VEEKTCDENYGIQHQNTKTHQFQGKIIKNTKTHKPRAKLQEKKKKKKKNLLQQRRRVVTFFCRYNMDSMKKREV
jgi:hypothetical protein